MPSFLADSHPAVSPNLTAALILASGAHLRRLGLPHPGVKQVLEATGATRTRAYEMKADLLALLPSLERPAGRPKAEPQPAPEQASTVTQEVLSFVLRHPGCAQQHAQRHRYSDVFRAFVIELHRKYSDMSIERFANETQVPLGTVKDWLHAPAIEVEPPSSEDTAAQDDRATRGWVQTLLEQWRDWHGNFSSFCDHVRFNLRIPFGRTRIASILRKYAGTDSADSVPVPDGTPVITDDAEWSLVLRLAQVELDVAAALETRNPAVLANTALDIARRFSVFYNACPVLNAGDDAVRKSRIALCIATRRTLMNLLGILGIEAPERM